MKLAVGLILFLLFLTACATSIIYSSRGEDLYHEKCGGCHRLYSKSELTSREWHNKIDEMSIKAKLSPDEKRMIIEFLTDNRTN